MNNLQYSAGERNRYFYGKLMTARDFEDEQTYLNDKRRLGNRMLHGAGIVAGLGVLLVDNQTFSLEAGMALDYLGREIVVQDPCVKRISAIRGRRSLAGPFCVADPRFFSPTGASWGCRPARVGRLSARASRGDVGARSARIT